MNARTFSFAELHREVLDALRSQHPEWVEPDGASPTGDHYEARLAVLLGLCPQVADGADHSGRLGQREQELPTDVVAAAARLE